MRKLLALTLLTLPINVFANSIYVGGNIALGSSDRSVFGDSASVLIGYDFPVSAELSLGIEAEYRDFGDESYYFNWSGLRDHHVKAKSYGLNIKPTYHFDFEGRNFYLSGILGVHEHKEKWRVPLGNQGYEMQTFSDTAVTWGAEFGLKLNQTLALNSGFKRSRPHLKGGSVEYDQFFMGLNLYF
ncbi:outer membrane beta-barrel protein [Thaumasiovibrio subtropicus]|uniref:outer membrane beta-barrel protein n=1 Tax=Thaumasiovibrio subtropicus TaxID=1891207 RepID=UPI000B34B6F0|nr:outer membrane beta-barrel protein [Thaumasiovibrio subtropicus]